MTFSFDLGAAVPAILVAALALTYLRSRNPATRRRAWRLLCLLIGSLFGTPCTRHDPHIRHVVVRRARRGRGRGPGR